MMTKKLSEILNNIRAYFQNNLLTFVILAVVFVVSYGFELFNMHLSIDEELSSLRPSGNLSLISNGRWGQFLLSTIFVNKLTVPFLPLALSLVSHLASMLILFACFNIEKQPDRTVLAGISMTWPGLCFVYSLSTINFAVGLGFFCISLILLILIKANKFWKFLATFPIALIIGTYQPLLVPLLMVCILFLIYRWKEEYHYAFSFLSYTVLVLGLGFFLSFLIQQIFLFMNHTRSTGYALHYFLISGVFQNLTWYLQKLARLAYNIFVGDSSFYGVAIRSLPIFLLFAGILILVTHYQNRTKNGNFILFLGLLGIFSILPFIGGVLTKGYIPYRSLLGVPIFLMGWAALALKYASPKAKIVLGVLAVFTLFQFALSTNHLFASSAFAYEEDKLLAYQLVDRIEDEKAKAPSENLQYIELIGYVDRPSTPLVSRIENIGASFFGWDQGNTSRVVNFLRVLGYSAPDALPVEKRAEFVSPGIQMPVWPAFGSVQIIGNTILVKFSPYSETQIKDICEYEGDYSLPDHFCPKD